MNPDERRSILDHLDEGRTAVREELRGLSDEQASFRAGPDRWSIRDCVEHIALSEAVLLRLVASQSWPAEPATEGREEIYLRHSKNRSRRFAAPEGLLPVGRFPSLQAAIETFLEARAATVQYVETIEDDLRARKTTHPVAGEITCRECLALLLGHPLRHLDQIREIKASPGYPA